MPRYSWHLEPRDGVRVYEIRDAAAWVRLITTYPRVVSGFVYPDWRTIAEHWDAVHIGLRAIAAAQGIFFATRLGPTAAPYWDVESTFLAELVLYRGRAPRGRIRPVNLVPAAAAQRSP
jgi:hypothetical protein